MSNHNAVVVLSLRGPIQFRSRPCQCVTCRVTSSEEPGCTFVNDQVLLYHERLLVVTAEKPACVVLVAWLPLRRVRPCRPFLPRWRDEVAWKCRLLLRNICAHRRVEWVQWEEWHNLGHLSAILQREAPGDIVDGLPESVVGDGAPEVVALRPQLHVGEQRALADTKAVEGVT